MRVVPSITFSLSGNIDESGGTLPLGEVTVRTDSSPLPDWPDEVTVTRSAYSYEWSFATALCAVPKFLADEPTKVFSFEWADWWAVPRTVESVWFVWKREASGENEQPPVPVEKSMLAESILEYCRTSERFSTDSRRNGRFFEMARRSLDHYDRGEGVPRADLRYEEARAWFTAERDSRIDSRAEPFLERDAVIERLVADLRTEDVAEFVRDQYGRLLTDERYKRTTLDVLFEDPDPRVLGVFMWSIYGADTDVVVRKVDVTAAVLDRWEAFSADRREQSPDPVDQFSTFANHSDAAVREHLADVLAAVDDERVTDVLQTLAADDVAAVRERALASLRGES